jgi:hypothetical protein
MFLKYLKSSIFVLVGLCSTGMLSQAQNGLDVYFGVGTMQDSSNGTSIDTFNTGNVGPANTPGYFNTPKLTGTFGKAGADFMFTPHFGVGGEADFRFSQGNYAGLNYRPTFYDFYGIYQPTHHGRIVPEIIGGIGAVNLKFYANQQYCDAFAGCSTSNYYLESSNHFQVHVGVGVSIYLTQHIFLRPQVDAHYVNNFYQFGSNWVPEYSASIGYRFGEH